jgi:ribonuclease BN (tRNA processing enzyme)
VAVHKEGQTLAYATDVSDTPGNREILTRLARGVGLFLCEAGFLEEDAERARSTGHLTARACAEIAVAAEVGRLLPCHLSARYRERPEAVFREILEIFERVVVPPQLGGRLGAKASQPAPARSNRPQTS